MGSTEIPYHPEADLTTDSIIRIHSCLTQLEKLRDVIKNWRRSYIELHKAGKAANLTACPPKCLAVIRRTLDQAIRSIDEGRRASVIFVETITEISKELQTHEDEMRCARSRTDKAYSKQLEKALSEAVTLRDRIADK